MIFLNIILTPYFLNYWDNSLRARAFATRFFSCDQILAYKNVLNHHKKELKSRKNRYSITIANSHLPSTIVILPTVFHLKPSFISI